MFKNGDVVTPKCPAGLWLSDRAPTGAYQQVRKNVCVFQGVGTIVARKSCVIDYDEWDRRAAEGEGEVDYNLGQVKYTSYLVECDSGTGWAGEGAIVPV